MKITRLRQESNPSCECGGKKSSTKEKPFVFKNKIYETRSGIKKRQDKFSDPTNGFSIKKVNLRSKVYVKEMETQVLDLPLKRNIKLISCQQKTTSPRRNHCDISKNKKVINGRLKCDEKDQQLENTTFDRKNLVCKIEKEDIAVSNSNTSFSVETSINHNISINGLFKRCDTVIKQENGNTVSNITKKIHTADINEPNNTEDGTIKSELEISINEMKQKQTRNRKTNFELFINETCENLKLGSVNCKRERKMPSYVSMLSPKKVKECFNSNTKSSLTLAGVPKKKSGRKPKPKGPIYHYLDLYEKDKVMHIANNATYNLQLSNKNNDIEMTNNHEIDLENTPKTQNHIIDKLDTNNCDNVKVKLDKTTPSPICTDLQFRYRAFSTDSYTSSVTPENNSPQLKRKWRCGKLLKQKKRKVEKIEASDYSSSVSHVLGFRTNKAVREVLVHFEDGTSNWIPYMERELDKCNLQTFFEHDEQDLSITNRLGYQVVCGDTETDNESGSNSTTTADSELSCFGEDLENDIDDVFFTALPFRYTDQVQQTNCVVPTDLPSKLINNCLLSDKDLNNVLDYVMSSHNVKLYPYESLQEVVFKSQEEFVHIYLKRILTSKIINSLNLKSCEKLITILEECAFNQQCKVVVISGIEEYFALNNIFDKLLKKSAALERAKYEQDVSVIRYLIQTIRNFNKPIVGVIKKTANGLSASLLSLFDMVFHEKTGNFSKTKPHRLMNINKKRKGDQQNPPAKNNIVANENCSMDTETCQTFVFPRLLGLSESNEAKIMGENQTPRTENYNMSSYFNSSLSHQLKGSIKHMKNNCKIQIKSRSSRTQSTNTRSSIALNDHDIATSQMFIHRQPNGNPEELIELERRVRQEKKLAESYMTELQATLNSLIS